LRLFILIKRRSLLGPAGRAILCKEFEKSYLRPG
jgi:hypothetical protein